MLSALMGILGLAFGGTVALFGPIIGEYFGLTHMGKVMGLLMSYGIWAAILGPFVLGGYLVDVTGSFQQSFVTAALICGIATIVAFLSRPAVQGNHENI